MKPEHEALVAVLQSMIGGTAKHNRAAADAIVSLSAELARYREAMHQDLVAEVRVSECLNPIEHGRFLAWLTNPADLPEGTKLYVRPTEAK